MKRSLTRIVRPWVDQARERFREWRTARASAPEPIPGSLQLPTMAERMIASANIRAFEHWTAARAQSVKTPLRAYTSASVALHEPGTPPVVVVVVGLRGRAWFALGLLHLWAWFKVSWVLPEKEQGYSIKVWVQ